MPARQTASPASQQPDAHSFTPFLLPLRRRRHAARRRSSRPHPQRKEEQRPPGTSPLRVGPNGRYSFLARQALGKKPVIKGVGLQNTPPLVIRPCFAFPWGKPALGLWPQYLLQDSPGAPCYRQEHGPMVGNYRRSRSAWISLRSSSISRRRIRSRSQ